MATMATSVSSSIIAVTRSTSASMVIVFIAVVMVVAGFDGKVAGLADLDRDVWCGDGGGGQGGEDHGVTHLGRM